MSLTEVTIAICGHAKHGKSTLAGRIVFELGGVTQADLDRKWLRASNAVPQFAQYAKDFNKYNYIFLEKNPEIRDSDGQRSNPSRTAVPSRASVALGDRRLTIIDEPGYSRFIGNLVYGIYMADCAVLVVEAKAGVASGTELVAKLLAQFRIPIIGVCLTKMDEIGFSEQEYREYEQQVKEILSLIGAPQSTPVIPVHALGDNALDSSIELSWYHGKGIVQIIQSIDDFREAHDSRDLRFATKEVFSPPGAGTVFVGILEKGILKTNDNLILEPASSILNRDVTFRARSMQRARSLNEEQRPNESAISARAVVSIATGDLPRNVAARYLKHGGMIGTIDKRPTVAKRILAQIIFFRSATVYAGKLFTLHCNAARTDASIVSIIEKRGIGGTMDGEECDLVQGEIVKAELLLAKLTCLESDEAFGRLARFILRQDNEVIACGRCVSVLSA